MILSNRQAVYRDPCHAANRNRELTMDDTRSKVSILIPVYNRANMISGCIQSALEQTYQDIEVVVVDNDSTDGTWEICKALSEKDSRLRVFRNETNIGPVENWKKCIDLARGTYGKILFSDDLLSRDYVEKALPLIGDDVAFVFSSVKIGPDPEHAQIHYQRRNAAATGAVVIDVGEYIKEVLMGFGALVSPGAALFRLKDLKENFIRELPARKLHGFSYHGAGPDLLLFLLTALRYKKVAHLTSPLVFFRKHADSATTKALTQKNWPIRECYTQTRLWFAENYLDNKMVGSLLARAWVSEITAEHNYSYLLHPRKLAIHYLDNPNKVSMIDFVVSLPISLIGAGWYALKNCTQE